MTTVAHSKLAALRITENQSCLMQRKITELYTGEVVHAEQMSNL